METNIISESLNSWIQITWFEKYIEQMSSMTLQYLPKIIGAIIVIWIGFKIANFSCKLVRKLLSHEQIDTTVEKFIGNLVSIILKSLVLIAAAWMVWVQTASFIALLGAAGLAIGLSLSGTLSNFSSWIVILIFRNYKIWDWVEISWYFWKVVDISIFFTNVLTWDGRNILIPNTEAISGSIVNYTQEDLKRLDIDVGIGYSDSIDKAREVMVEIWKKNIKILNDHNISVIVQEMWDNAVILQFRGWTKMDNYLPVRAEITEEIKKQFDKQWISFPFPQRDVHLYKTDK